MYMHAYVSKKYQTLELGFMQAIIFYFFILLAIKMYPFVENNIHTLKKYYCNI